MQQASQIRVCDSGLRLGSAPNLSPDPQPNPRKIPLPAGLRALDELDRTIAARAAQPASVSYTNQLLAGGIAAIGAKIVEEAAEVVAAAGETGDSGRDHLIAEAGDLLYHLLVLLRSRDCSLADVEAELARRAGVSGLTEKALRPPSQRPA